MPHAGAHASPVLCRPKLHFLLNQYVNLLPLTRRDSGNIYPLEEYVFPLDKASLCTSQAAVEFKLIAEGLSRCSNSYNTQKDLITLKRLVFREAYGVSDIMTFDSNPNGQAMKYVKAARQAAEDEVNKLKNMQDGLDAMSFSLTCSPLNAVTLPEEAKTDAKIHADAAFFCFCYPAVKDTITDDMIREAGINDFDPCVQWLQTGGFFYFDFKYELLQISALCWTEVPSPMLDKTSSLCLGHSTPLPASCVEPLLDLGRWDRVPTDLISDFGFAYFGWVNPAELLGNRIFSQNGGFVFLHKDDFDPHSWEKELPEAILSSPFSKDKGGKSRYFPVVPTEAHYMKLNEDGVEKPSMSKKDFTDEVDKLTSMAEDLFNARTSQDKDRIKSLDEAYQKQENLVITVLKDHKMITCDRGRFSAQEASQALYIPEMTAPSLDIRNNESNLPPPRASRYAGKMVFQESRAAAHGLQDKLGSSDSPFSLEKRKKELKVLMLSQVKFSDTQKDKFRESLKKLHGEHASEELLEKEMEELTLLAAETADLDAAKLTKLEEAGCIHFRVKSIVDGNKIYETAEQLELELTENVTYVLREPAKKQEMDSNDGTGKVIRDDGHEGWTLAVFHKLPQAQIAKLSLAMVAALRLYTSSHFRVINGPLRKESKPHPLAATVWLISEGLKKLRAVHMESKRVFRPTYLWRGMKDVKLPDDFERTGGCELACVSTSKDMRVVAKYAKSNEPLIFRLKIDSPMDLAPPIKWLSMFPHEEEYLYPPLTYLRFLYKQEIKHTGGYVATVSPSFP